MKTSKPKYTGTITKSKTAKFRFWAIWYWDHNHYVALFESEPKWDKVLEEWSFDDAIEWVDPAALTAMGIPVVPDQNTYDGGRTKALMTDPVLIELELPITEDGDSIVHSMGRR